MIEIYGTTIAFIFIGFCIGFIAGLLAGLKEGNKWVKKESILSHAGLLKSKVNLFSSSKMLIYQSGKRRLILLTLSNYVIQSKRKAVLIQKLGLWAKKTRYKIAS